MYVGRERAQRQCLVEDKILSEPHCPALAKKSMEEKQDWFKSFLFFFNKRHYYKFF
jgi:hypothetical protein